MADKEDYLTSYREFFENFAAIVNPEDQLPVQVAGYSITEEELLGEVIYWTTQYLIERQCPQSLMTPLRRIISDEVLTAAKKQPDEFGYDSQNAVFIALRLMQAVTARVNAVCLRYLDNSRLDTLPVPSAIRERRTVSAATKNRRRVMEDRHVEIGDLEALFGIQTTEPTSFYAVYDGHAGSAAATYCAAHLHQYLVESPHFAQNLPWALRDAFHRTDTEFVKKQNEKRACGGSTAVVVVVRGKVLHAAWAGDSQALLAKRMRLMQLVLPHKPNREDERIRIEASGGTVIHWGIWRVNGQLAVSRAIGDAKYKPYVTARPEIETVELDGDEDFVVVACDGLWDFVSEDQVALSVYCQLANDADDLKAVTKRLLLQAKQQSSTDNISVIVVFLKEPRDIAAENCSPMELGLDNALANAPAFAVEPESCKRPTEVAGADVDADADGAEAADNGVDNSDSDSEDLGPETAVDADEMDVDLGPEHDGDAISAERAPRTPPTPLVHTVEQSQQVDGALGDNVADSGEESEDEWNYFKGEGEKEEREPRSEEPDEPPRSETPCQDNSAWESSSVDMNSSPLNPDAPVFVPGGVASGDLLLAESPRKPVPMDDIELPTDVAQFRTEAVDRPAELLDLDNCDHLNGHHNVTLEAEKEKLNGNEKSDMDSLGFGFNVGVDSDKAKDTSLLQDLERIQKDTMDFGNIQVFQAHTDVSPMTAEIDEELFERLKNKERDPMSMSFYQEKDDDTCERFAPREPQVDLNAVQTLPDSDDDDLMESNGDCEVKFDKENVDPEIATQPVAVQKETQEPNNDDRTDLLGNASVNTAHGDNFMDYNISNSNMTTFSNINFDSGDPQNATVLPTDTPESHKLLFEQIPEIPDGKSSELGFATEDTLDPLEGEAVVQGSFTRQEQFRDIPQADNPFADNDAFFTTDNKDDGTARDSDIPENLTLSSQIPSMFEFDNVQDGFHIETDVQFNANPFDAQVDDIVNFNSDYDLDMQEKSRIDECLKESTPKDFNESTEFRQEVKADVHENELLNTHSGFDRLSPLPQHDVESNSPLPTESQPVSSPQPMSPLPVTSPLLSESPLPSQSSLPAEPALATESPVPTSDLQRVIPSASPLPAESLNLDSFTPSQSSMPPAEIPSESSLPPLPSSQLKFEEQICESRLTPDIAFVADKENLCEKYDDSMGDFTTTRHVQETATGRMFAEPTPDLVPGMTAFELPSRPVTDIDVGIPESRAQEICVPVTNEIRQEDVALESNIGTPTPTPLVEPSAPPLDQLSKPEQALLVDQAVSANTQTSAHNVDTQVDLTTVLTGVMAAVTATATTAAAVAATRKATTTKKPSASLKATPATKSSPRPAATARTPTPATKKTPSTTPIAKPPSSTTPKTTVAARTPGSIPKTAAVKPPTPKVPAAPKPATTNRAVSTNSKDSIVAAKATAAAKSTPATATKPAVKPAVPRSAPMSARAASAPSRPPATKTATSTLSATRLTATRAVATTAAKPKEATAATKVEKKPLTNGDLRPAAKKPSPSVTLTAKPAPKPPAPATRPVPRPAPRTAPSSATTVTATTKTNANGPKPTPRAAPRPALDKQSKDLANKRITAKAAPPRTASTKASPTTKSAAPAVRGPIRRPVAVDASKKETVESGTLTNGASEPALAKPPLSPPAADNALLPDVIA